MKLIQNKIPIHVGTAFEYRENYIIMVVCAGLVGLEVVYAFGLN